MIPAQIALFGPSWRDGGSRLAAAIGLIGIAALALLSCASGVTATERPWTTLNGRHVVGYQGWFACPSDAGGRGWRHWFRGGQPSVEALTVDMWPDTSGFDQDELCPTPFVKPDGGQAFLFSSQQEKTVDRHFSWMREHGIDGVALQRFVATVSTPAGRAQLGRVLENVRNGAASYGRAVFIMYDISGADPERWAEELLTDWQGLVASGLLQDETYWRHRDKPVLAIWGMGFTDRPGTAEQAAQLLARLRAHAGGVTLLGGVPAGWRTLDRDSKREPGWGEVYQAFDILSPWAVGRYADARSWAAHLRSVGADLKRSKESGQDYMPVVFPGYSFGNAKRDASWFDRIPRRCGAFYWMQIRDLARNGFASMLYTAMFDEVDEATALIPVTRSAETPATSRMVTLDSNGCAPPPDWYLYIAGLASRIVRGELAPSDQIPGPVLEVKP